MFGAALDPSDADIKVLIKQNYLEMKASGLKGKSPFRDPVHGFIAESKLLQDSTFEIITNFPIESWLCPKPEIGDEVFMSPLDFRLFLDSNGCKEYSDKIEKFIAEKVLPDVPLMIGADHSMTGGVLSALSKKYGAENITLIVLDGHFDGIPTYLRLDLAKYTKEHKDEVTIPFPEMMDSLDAHAEIPQSYNCGTFLYNLIEDEMISPENLIVFGCMDYPSDELKAIQDPRVKKYVDFYLAYEQKGVKIIPNFKDNDRMKRELKSALQTVNTPYLYLSIDVDVSSLNAVLAARFMDFIGVDKECLRDTVEVLKQFIQSNEIELIGMDIMEIETHFLNAKLKSGKEDKTIEVMEPFIELLVL